MIFFFSFCDIVKKAVQIVVEVIKGEKIMSTKFEKFFTLDKVFIIILSLLIFYIIEERNILDFIYTIVLIFYYIRIKIYRKRKNI